MLDDFIAHPHDHLFRESFSRVESVVPFLREVLPEEVARACDWEHLRVLPGQWIDETLKELESDLFYEIPMTDGHDLLVYVPFEETQAALSPAKHPELRSEAMTIAQELEQRGMIKGREQGLEAGTIRTLRQSIRQAVDIRFGIAAASSIASQLELFQNAEKLEALFRQVLTASTVEAAVEAIRAAAKG